MFGSFQDKILDAFHFNTVTLSIIISILVPYKVVFVEIEIDFNRF